MGGVPLPWAQTGVWADIRAINIVHYLALKVVQIIHDTVG